MENRPKISIIIPVYNTGEYLSKCLDSLIYQTYDNIELICVNDGSTDNSLSILEEYAKKDSRIKVFSQENSGQSAARNLGLSIATGDYISFIDSDDWVFLTLYQTFVDVINKAGKYIDIWMFNVSSYIEGQNDVVPRVFFEALDWDRHTDDNVIHVFDDCARPFSRNLSAANKIYRKDFLNDINLRFPVGLKFEDQYFSLKAFLNAQSIMFTEDVFYRYRNYHSTSISIALNEKVFDIFKVLSLVEEEINRLNVYESYKYALFQYKYNVFFQHYVSCPSDLKDKYYAEMKQRLLEAEKKDLNSQIYSRLSNSGLFFAIRDNDRKHFDNFIAKLRKQ